LRSELAKLYVKLDLVTQYPSWYFLLCIALGVGYAVGMYRGRRERYEWSNVLHLSLSSVRTVVVAFIAFFLLNPMLSVILRETEKPLLVIAQDVSTSVVNNADSTFYKGAFQDELTELVDNLRAEHEVRIFTFGDGAQESDYQGYTGKVTDISEVAEEIRTRYSGRNLGAIILASDGIYNKGRRPRYAFSPINAPVFTVAMGDTTVKKDLVLKNVAFNRIGYLGNTIPFEATILAERADGAFTMLTVLKNGKQLFEKRIDISGSRYLVNVPLSLQADQVGIQRYTFQLSSIEGELSTVNNRMDVYIDVLDSRQKVLILASAPHPDIAAFQNAIGNNDNYEVESVLLDDTPENLSEYSLLILHQVPSSGKSKPRLLERIVKSKVPLLLVLGADTDVRTLDQLGTGLSLTNSNRQLNGTQAVYSEGFQLFTLDPKDVRTFEQAPPLHMLFGQYSAANVSVLFNQKVGMVKTDDPLFFFNTQGVRKIAMITGEGIWRWRTHDFRVNGNHEAFDRLIGKTVQYLALKEDKSRFRVNGKSDLRENDKAVFEGELYNKSYELVNDPDVEMIIRDAEGDEFPFNFTRTNNTYKLNAGSLPVGNYSYEAVTRLDGERFSEHGEFSVSAIQLEATNTVADHKVLFDLSEQSGGTMIRPDQLSELETLIGGDEDIVARTYSKTSLSDLIDIKELFFAILALLSLEWFLRKRNGAY